MDHVAVLWYIGVLRLFPQFQSGLEAFFSPHFPLQGERPTSCVLSQTECAG